MPEPRCIHTTPEQEVIDPMKRAVEPRGTTRANAENQGRLLRRGDICRMNRRKVGKGKQKNPGILLLINQSMGKEKTIFKIKKTKM